MSEDARRARWPLIALLAAVGLVVVIALVAVLVRGGNPVAFAENTPEGVVQRYSQAVIDGDQQTALTYVVPEVASSCEHTGTSEDVRVTLLKTQEHDTGATVEVRIASLSNGGWFGASEYSNDDSFQLVKPGDTWLIQSAPWQLAVCIGLQK
jgi:hypothetical protein